MNSFEEMMQRLNETIEFQITGRVKCPAGCDCGILGEDNRGRPASCRKCGGKGWIGPRERP